MKRKIFNMPNTISLLRIPLAFLVILFFQSPLRYLFFILGIFFDFLDGYLARKLKQITKLGGIIDPLTDKVFALTIFLFGFALLKLPSYYLLFFFLRDIFTVSAVLFLYLTKQYKKLEIKARFFGKIVTLMQFTVLVFVVIGNLFWIKITIFLLLLAAVVSIVDYILYYTRKRK
ncbi:CDP-alcohol phosphatidyltransferase family protein [Nanoarchaeota archaeon]